jgi:hypothetical protein
VAQWLDGFLSAVAVASGGLSRDSFGMSIYEKAALKCGMA